MFKLFAILLVVILLGVPSFLYNSYYKVVIKPKKDAEAQKSTPDAGPAITSDSENVESRPSVHKKTEKKYERYLGV